MRAGTPPWRPGTRSPSPRRGYGGPPPRVVSVKPDAAVYDHHLPPFRGSLSPRVTRLRTPSPPRNAPTAAAAAEAARVHALQSELRRIRELEAASRDERARLLAAITELREAEDRRSAEWSAAAQVRSERAAQQEARMRELASPRLQRGKRISKTSAASAPAAAEAEGDGDGAEKKDSAAAAPSPRTAAKPKPQPKRGWCVVGDCAGIPAAPAVVRRQPDAEDTRTPEEKCKHLYKRGKEAEQRKVMRMEKKVKEQMQEEAQGMQSRPHITKFARGYRQDIPKGEHAKQFWEMGVKHQEKKKNTIFRKQKEIDDEFKRTCPAKPEISKFAQGLRDPIPKDKFAKVFGEITKAFQEKKANGLVRKTKEREEEFKRSHPFVPQGITEKSSYLAAVADQRLESSAEGLQKRAGKYGGGGGPVGFGTNKELRQYNKGLIQMLAREAVLKKKRDDQDKEEMVGLFSPKISSRSREIVARRNRRAGGPPFEVQRTAQDDDDDEDEGAAGGGKSQSAWPDKAPPPQVGKRFMVRPEGQAAQFPGTVSELTEEYVRFEFEDKRNLGRQDIPKEYWFDGAFKPMQKVKKRQAEDEGGEFGEADVGDDLAVPTPDDLDTLLDRLRVKQELERITSS
eukprot:TRINITY_DN1291_c0_g1_i2.p1 TRINITY_DN1291_c0_g1~~TRINITY_DN1291_c0_g1_i2.p1  ORF type:complete len:626 (+),score=191.86 TRINITY_DN1291_c0_g1_i2:78-1955(+)